MDEFNESASIVDAAKRTGKTITIQMVKRDFNGDGEIVTGPSERHKRRITWFPLADASGHAIQMVNEFDGEVTFRRTLLRDEAVKMVRKNVVESVEHRSDEQAEIDTNAPTPQERNQR